MNNDKTTKDQQECDKPMKKNNASIEQIVSVISLLISIGGVIALGGIIYEKTQTNRELLELSGQNMNDRITRLEDLLFSKE